MIDLSHLPPLRDVLRDNELRATKKLGQNFLLDLNLTDKIVRAAGDLSDVTVFEVGPGPGGLTRSLLQNKVQKVIAVEYDLRAVKALQSLKDAAGGALEIIHGDALNTDLSVLAKTPCAIVANLPYNIATPLLIGWLAQIRENKNSYQSMTLMFQREVAMRITASVGSKAYGRLTVLCQWLCDVNLCFDVPASAFTPPPKVMSSVVYFRPKKLPQDAPSFSSIEKVTSEAFGQRRKMIRSSLKNYKEYFEEVGLDETLRAENLTPVQFIKLAKLADKKEL